MKAMIKSSQQVMDGSDVMELVDNDKVFTNFLDHKFQQLDADCAGNLSRHELQPAVYDIGAAPGLPAHGLCPGSDHIYSEVLDEFKHGKQKISKTEFRGVLSDILVGMAAGLKRDPVVILRIDGDDLHDFINSPTFEPEILSLLSDINLEEGSSLKDYIIKAFQKLSVDHGVPPATDPWVLSNVLEPALEQLGDSLQEPASQETFLGEFKRAAEFVAGLLKEQPAIVAHSQNTFDGSGIRRLLSNKFELEKTLDSAVKSAHRDGHGKISKECLNIVVDDLAASAGLPPLGAVDQMDSIITEALKTLDAGDGSTVKEDDLKNLLAQVLRSIMLQLEGNPVSISINSVVHQPLPSSSALLHPSSP